MTRKAMLPVAAILSVVVAACAVPMLTPQQSGQYCAVDVRGPSGAPAFVPGTLLDPAAEAGAEALANASLVGVFFLGVLTNLPLLELGDPRAGIHAAHACDPDKLPRASAPIEFKRVVDTTEADVLTRALKSALDAPRAACSSPRARGDRAAGPDGRLEIESVGVVAGCLYGQMAYRVDVRWTLNNADSGTRVVANTTQCVLESRRAVEDWLDRPAEAHAEIEGALAATGQRVAKELIVGYLPAAQCRLGSDAAGNVSVR